MATNLDDLGPDDPVLVRLGNPSRWRYARVIEPGQEDAIWVQLLDTTGLARDGVRRIEVALHDVQRLARWRDPQVPPTLTEEDLHCFVSMRIAFGEAVAKGGTAAEQRMVVALDHLLAAYEGP